MIPATIGPMGHDVRMPMPNILTPEQVAEAYAALDERGQFRISRMLSRPTPGPRRGGRPPMPDRGVERMIGRPTPKNDEAGSGVVGPRDGRGVGPGD